MKKLIILALLVIMTVSANAQFWKDKVEVLDGWLNAATSEVYYDATVDSVLRVNLGVLPTNAFITAAGAYTLDGWNATGHGGPVDSVCIGYKGDLDCIVDEASCAAAGLDNTLIAGSMINNLTDGATAYTPVYGYYRITSNGNYRATGKTYFYVIYHMGISEP